MWVLLVNHSCSNNCNRPFSVDTSNKQEINYTEFVKQVDDKNVAKVVMQNSNIKGTLKDGTEFTTITPGYPNSDEELVKLFAIMA